MCPQERKSASKCTQTTPAPPGRADAIRCLLRSQPRPQPSEPRGPEIIAFCRRPTASKTVKRLPRVAHPVTPIPTGASPPETPPEVGPEEAKELLEQGALVVDVRETWELEQIRITDAVHIPLMELPRRMHELPRDRTLVMLCRSGGRSQQAARLLSASGYDDVLNLQGGILGWHHAGLPTRRGAED